jgi:hypothetical protein
VKKICLAFWIGILLIGLAACVSAQSVNPTSELPSQTPLPSSTPTIQWFPATATPSPVPTQNIEPTLDLRQGMGELQFGDNFTTPSLWQTAASDAGSIAFGNGVLTLAVKQAKTSLLSMRSAGSLTDFYLQMGITPGLCRGQDAFGIVVRAASNFNYYRFLTNCDGQLRVERVKNGVAVVLQDWTPTGQLMPGSMQGFQIGILANKNEFRVFINDIFQFYVRDTVWTAGGLGVYARSAGDTPLTVNFSDLSVWSILPGKVTPIPTITPTVTPTPRS